jgi:hypothetical protein
MQARTSVSLASPPSSPPQKKQNEKRDRSLYRRGRSGWRCRRGAAGGRCPPCRCTAPCPPRRPGGGGGWWVSVDLSIHPSPSVNPFPSMTLACLLVHHTIPYLVHGELRRDAERVAELRLARAELPEDLRQRAGLDPACFGGGVATMGVVGRWQGERGWDGRGVDGCRGRAYRPKACRGPRSPWRA